MGAQWCRARQDLGYRARGDPRHLGRGAAGFLGAFLHGVRGPSCEFNPVRGSNNEKARTLQMPGEFFSNRFLGKTAKTQKNPSIGGASESNRDTRNPWRGDHIEDNLGRCPAVSTCVVKMNRGGGVKRPVIQNLPGRLFFKISSTHLPTERFYFALFCHWDCGSSSSCFPLWY